MEPTMQMPTEAVKRTWKCEIHGTVCKLISPCHECVRETKHPEIVESELRTPENSRIREKNSKARVRA